MNQPGFNPFNITKAVDYSDEEIDQAWVDLPSGGFIDMVKPKSAMPMLILGGKGSGKTHIMRYFSYRLQKIRYGDNWLTLLKNDGYLGIYMRCGGLNANRFNGKGLTEEQWRHLFSYYTELWLAQLVLDAVQDILIRSSGSISFSEAIITQQIIQLFDKVTDTSIDSIHKLKSYLASLQKEVDYEVNQLALSRNGISDRLQILVSPGRLIFGLPQLLESTVLYFKSFQFIYLIDEYENLLTYQQQYFNTLIREKELPTTFRIGVRLYGLKTTSTFSANESIKVGSEYEIFTIDEVLRNNSGYNKYIKEICQRRLELGGYPTFRQDFNNYFETFSLENLNDELSKKAQRQHLIKLESKLGMARFNKSSITQILKNLTYEDNFLIERTNVFLFYRAWKNNRQEKELISISKTINQQAKEYSKGQKDIKTEHSKVLEKFKSDLIDQLCRENNILQPYYGFDNFVTMSAGLPRVLLKTLKEIYKQSYFSGEKPFVEGKISKKSQMKGLDISSAWFVEDASPTGDKAAKRALFRLGSFLQEIRFSDMPPECSICIFSVNNSYLSETSFRTIQLLKDYSYIINVSDRREKNDNAVSQTFQINGIIAPKWELAIHKRGVIHLNKEEAEAIFNESDEAFEDVLDKRKRRYNHPLATNNKSLPLFDDESN